MIRPIPCFRRNAKSLENDLHSVNSNLKSLEFSENKVRVVHYHLPQQLL